MLDDVILYHDKVAIPTSLRSRVLQILHSAHQGVLAMESRARAIVFWPGTTKDIIQTECYPINLGYLQRRLSQYLQIWWMPLLTCR